MYHVYIGRTSPHLQPASKSNTHRYCARKNIFSNVPAAVFLISVSTFTNIVQDNISLNVLAAKNTLTLKLKLDTHIYSARQQSTAPKQISISKSSPQHSLLEPIPFCEFFSEYIFRYFRYFGFFTSVSSVSLITLKFVIIRKPIFPNFKVFHVSKICRYERISLLKGH